MSDWLNRGQVQSIEQSALQLHSELWAFIGALGCAELAPQAAELGNKLLALEAAASRVLAHQQIRGASISKIKAQLTALEGVRLACST